MIAVIYTYLYCFALRTGLTLLIVMAGAACSAQSVASAAGKPAVHNPVIDANFADPTVIRANGKYYAYATQSVVNGKMWNIQVAVSTDLQHWAMINDALPEKPVWANATQNFWAPHVLYDKQLKKYILFFSAKSNDTTTDKCIGIAFADSPCGPFKDKGSPLICGKGFVNIDPMAIIDPVSHKKLLYWGSGFEPIKVRQMANDWTSFAAGSKTMPVVFPGREKNYTNLLEGAWLDYANGKYYLYYSGDNCCGPRANYAVMVARADKAWGPFVSVGSANGSGSSVVSEKSNDWNAPGHNSIFRDDRGGAWIAYHAIPVSKETAGGPDGKRVFCLSRLAYRDGWPQITIN